MKIQVALVRNNFEILRPTTYLSPIIQWADKCYYNHSIVILEDETGKWVYHAQLKVKKEKWEDYILQCDRELLIGDPLEMIDSPKEWLESHVGKWYDIKGICIIALDKLGLDYTSYLYDKQRKRFFCTEYVAGLSLMSNEPEQTPSTLLSSDKIVWGSTVYTMKDVGLLNKVITWQ